mgnify:CR=1 FL=1
MKVFISYHRADSSYREKLENILTSHNIDYYVVPEEKIFDGKSHEFIKTYIINKMKKCDVLICLIGKDTYKRPHVDHEMHAALKGGIEKRKGIVAVMLETRDDRINNIDPNTFPTKIQQNKDFVVLTQFASLHNNFSKLINKAYENAKDETIQVDHTNPCMKLRSGKYYDIN